MSNFEVNEYLREHLEKKEVKKVASDLSVMVYTDRTLSDGRLMEMLKYIKTSYPDVYEQLIKKCDESQFKRLSMDGQLLNKDINEDTFADAVFALENTVTNTKSTLYQLTVIQITYDGSKLKQFGTGLI